MPCIKVILDTKYTFRALTGVIPEHKPKGKVPNNTRCGSKTNKVVSDTLHLGSCTNQTNHPNLRYLSIFLTHSKPLSHHAKAIVADEDTQTMKSKN